MPKRAQLVLLSFLMLFVGLALIRWTGANVIYLASGPLYRSLSAPVQLDSPLISGEELADRP